MFFENTALSRKRLIQQEFDIKITALFFENNFIQLEPAKGYYAVVSIARSPIDVTIMQSFFINPYRFP